MQEIKFVENKHLKEKPKDQSKLGFGRIFTDYMFTMEYNSKEGWHNAQVRPYENLSFDPATTFIHYGQAFFEGMKAYNAVDGVRLFRPKDNFARATRSAERLCMPALDEELALEGLKLLLEAKRQTGLPIVTEIMSEKHLDLFADVDIIQLGARNMQNFMLLKELGRCNKPILLKRGLSATMEEFLMAAEYIFAGGNKQVILCERGIRTFEKMIRNNLDLSAVPLVKMFSHLPIIIDPSHAAGRRDMVQPLSRAAIAAGADGLIIEAHNDPKHALCDGAQSLDLDQFDNVMADIKRRAEFEGRTMMP